MSGLRTMSGPHTPHNTQIRTPNTPTKSKSPMPPLLLQHNQSQSHIPRPCDGGESLYVGIFPRQKFGRICSRYFTAVHGSAGVSESVYLHFSAHHSIGPMANHLSASTGPAQFPMIRKRHPWRIPSFRRDLCNVLDRRHSIRNKRVPERIVLPVRVQPQPKARLP